MGTKNRLTFADKSHSEKGIMSVIFGFLSVTACVTLIILSFLQEANAGIYSGAVAVVAAVSAIVGLVFAFMGLKEEDKRRIMIYVGFFMNIAMIAGWTAIFML